MEMKKLSIILIALIAFIGVSCNTNCEVTHETNDTIVVSNVDTIITDSVDVISRLNISQ
jgi:hypothetical protein